VAFKREKVHKYDQSGPCKPGKTHKFTVMASIKGYKNCYHCGLTKWVG
jgi:hypothetical protein